MDSEVKKKVLKIFEDYNNKVAAGVASLEETKEIAFDTTLNQLMECREFRNEFMPTVGTMSNSTRLSSKQEFKPN